MKEGKPIPVADEASAGFYDNLRNGKLCIQRCRDCGRTQLGQLFCLQCESEDLAWVAASGRGHVHSFVVMHTLFHPAFAAEIPYNVAVVELDEGPRLYANILGISNEALRIGLRVSSRIVEIAQGTYVPAFAPERDK